MHTESIEFSSGLIAYMRGDLEQAARRMKSVAEMTDASSQVQTDARLLYLMARARQEADISKELTSALQSYPGSFKIRRVGTMSYLQAAAGARSKTERSVQLASARAYLESDELLETRLEGWPKQARALLNALSAKR